MNKEEATALAAHIEIEVLGASATIEPDQSSFPQYQESYHVVVCKPGVIQMSIKSVSQWEERKCLIINWQSHKHEKSN